MHPPPRATNQAMPTNKPGHGAGRAPSSTATARSAPRSWRGSMVLAAASHLPRNHLSLHLRPDRPHTICPGPKRNAADAASKAAARHRPAPLAGRAAGHRRGSPHPRALGGRSDVVPATLPGSPSRASHLAPNRRSLRGITPSMLSALRPSSVRPRPPADPLGGALSYRTIIRKMPRLSPSRGF